MRTLALVVAGSSALASACDTQPSMPSGLVAGAHGATLAGHVEITVIDEPSGAPVSGAVVRASDAATGTAITQASTDHAGFVRLEGAALTGSIVLEAASSTSAQIFFGVRTDEVVIALPGASAERPRVSGNVRGLPADTSSIVVGVATDVALLRTVSIDAATTVPCTRDGDGCSFSASVAGTSALAAATASNDAGEVVGFVTGHVGPSGGTLETSAAAEDLLLTLPAAAGFTGIIGVPGVAENGALVLLSQAQSSPEHLSVPALGGALEGASYWVIVEAQPMISASMVDPNARSVLFARGVHAAAELPTWTAWLAAPRATLDADVSVTFDAVATADVHVVDWIDAAGRVRASAWLLDDTILGVESLVPSGLAPREVASVRVRAIDTDSPPSASGFDAHAIEADVTRFSERTITR